MIAEVISTGTELMTGRGADGNFTWLARYLTDRGCDVRYHATYGDDRRDLENGVKLARARADLIVMTGGLGPTDDDLTRAVVAEVFHRPLAFHPRLVKRRRPAINLRQAWIPLGARVVRNPRGTAPGFIVHDGDVMLVALSGVPDEMRAMMRSVRLPGGAPRLQTFRLFGLPEAVVDEKLDGDYGITVSRGQITVTFRGGPDRRRFMRRTFGSNLFAEDERSLEFVVGEKLITSRRTLAVAESCTGGLVTDLLTDVPGISSVLLEGAVTYSNASKEARLGIRVVRAVSEETAVGMARGAAEGAGAQLGLSTTGVAGPGGHPVGLVWVAAWDGRPHTRRLQLRGDRRRIKVLAAMHALDLLRLTI